MSPLEWSVTLLLVVAIVTITLRANLKTIDKACTLSLKAFGQADYTRRIPPMEEWEIEVLGRQAYLPDPSPYMAVDHYCDFHECFLGSQEDIATFMLLVLEAEDRPLRIKSIPEDLETLMQGKLYHWDAYATLSIPDWVQVEYLCTMEVYGDTDSRKWGLQNWLFLALVLEAENGYDTLDT